MNKVKLFHSFDMNNSYTAYTNLENKINEFAEQYEILNVSLNVLPCGYKESYTAAVVYKEN